MLKNTKMVKYISNQKVVRELMDDNSDQFTDFGHIVSFETQTVGKINISCSVNRSHHPDGFYFLSSNPTQWIKRNYSKSDEYLTAEQSSEINECLTEAKKILTQGYMQLGDRFKWTYFINGKDVVTGKEKNC
jgi:hypothetical protein